MQYAIIAYSNPYHTVRWVQKNVPYIEPLRFCASYIVFILWQYFMPILIRRTGQNYYSDTEEVMPIEVIRKDKEEMEDTKLKNMEESKIERQRL